MLADEAELKKMTLVQLREQLRKAHLPVSGNKPLLVERLLAAPEAPSFEAGGSALIEIEACKS